MTVASERRPQCESTPHKIKYLTASDASTSRQARTFSILRPYHCWSCGYWHLTSKKGTDQ